AARGADLVGEIFGRPACSGVLDAGDSEIDELLTSRLDSKEPQLDARPQPGAVHVYSVLSGGGVLPRPESAAVNRISIGWGESLSSTAGAWFATHPRGKPGRGKVAAVYPTNSTVKLPRFRTPP